VSIRTLADRVPVGVPAAVVVAVSGLATIDSPGMWTDEAASVYFADRPTGGLLRLVTVDEANMGPYYLFVHVWRLAGDSDAWFRLPSLVAAVAAVLVLARIVLRWTGERSTAEMSAVVLALLPTMRFQAVEARGYTIVMLLGVLAVASLGAPDEGPRVRPLLLGTCVGLATALNVTAAAMVAAPLALLALTGSIRSEGRRLALAGGVALMWFAPFAYPFVVNDTQIDWIPERTIGQAYSRSLAGEPLLTHLVWACMLVCLAVGTVHLVRREPARQRTRFALAMAIGGLAPFLTLVVGGWWRGPMFVARYAIVALPPLAVCVALAPRALLDALPGRHSPRRHSPRTPTIVAAVLVVLVASASWLQRGPLTDRSLLADYRATVDHLRENASPGDTVVIVRRFAWWGLARYDADDLGLQVVSPAAVDSNVDPGDAVGRLVDAEIDPSADVWLIRPSGERPQGELARLMRELRRQGTVETLRFEGLVVVHITPDPTADLRR
jgi:hypothetical protein